MRVIKMTEKHDIATVYIAETDCGEPLEFVESVQPPFTREEKWVLIVSTLFGCPVGCPFCDAGNYFRGKISKDDMLAQIDYLITKRFPNRVVPIPKFKIQFARMGEPAFNSSVLEVLEELPLLYDAPGLMPCISTIAPGGCDGFFAKLSQIKKSLYRQKFQLQFSIHTTDNALRDRMMPIEKWSFEEIAEYVEAYFEDGDRKITLNFALAEGNIVEPETLLRYFNSAKFLIKITPINPTYRALKNDIVSQIVPEKSDYKLLDELKNAGYEVIFSFGELAENHIGSNCGQFITNYLMGKEQMGDSYTFELQDI